MKNLTIKKEIILAIIMGLIISMLPMTCFGATKIKAPKPTKIISAKLTDSREVTLKWKKVKGVTGYKIYRKKENTNLVYIGKVKGASKLTYVDTDLDKYDFGEIRYCVRTYKTKKGKTKTSSKRYTNRKSVRIIDMAWDPYTEPVNEEIYNAYKRASSKEISLYAIRELMLYAVNKERAEYWGG